jgi:Putative Actinobacterial Holin-X, holin superfamily III
MAVRDEPTSAGRTDASTAALVRQASEEISRLVRGELELAQAELVRKGRRAGVGAGLFGTSSILALYALGAFVIAAIFGLDEILPRWAAALVVGGALLLIAIMLALFGRSQVTRAAPPVPEQAARGVRADIETIREGLHR